MRTLIYSAIIFICFFFTSCSGSDFEPSIYGDSAVVKMKSGSKYEGELLYINDSSLYLVNQNKINAFSTKKIEDISIDKYSDRSWILGVTLLQVVPAIAISSLAAGYNVDFALTLSLTMIPAVITTILFESSTPKSSFDHINSRHTRAELYKYTRYPGGMTTGQLNDLLRMYKQDSCIKIQ